MKKSVFLTVNNSTNNKWHLVLIATVSLSSIVFFFTGAFGKSWEIFKNGKRKVKDPLMEEAEKVKRSPPGLQMLQNRLSVYKTCILTNTTSCVTVFLQHWDQFLPQNWILNVVLFALRYFTYGSLAKMADLSRTSWTGTLILHHYIYIPYTFPMILPILSPSFLFACS